MKKFLVLLYGVVAYLLFQATFLYLIGFVGNLFVPKGIDGGYVLAPYQAIIIDFILLALFGLQHSVMARPWFKKYFTRIIPEVIERSTYVIFTCIALIIMFVFWQPLDGMVWSVDNPYLAGVLLALFGLGWATVLVSSFLINHFDLFGLRQVWLYFRGQPYTALPFRTPFLYKWVRHPLYFGLLLAFWAAPVMSVTRLFFALVLTTYVLKAIGWEENDMVKVFGEKYRNYKKQVPMILPSFFRKEEKAPQYETILKGE